MELGTKETTPEQFAKKEQELPLFNRILRVAAYPIALASGLWATHTDLRNTSYDSARRQGAFNDLLEKHRPIASQGVQDRIAGKISAEEFFQQAMKNKGEYSKAVDERMKTLGVKSMFDKWKYINRADKKHALVEGMKVVGISLGAMLTVANSKSLVDFFVGDKKHHPEMVHISDVPALIASAGEQVVQGPNTHALLAENTESPQASASYSR
jgi:hypothetical protein